MVNNELKAETQSNSNQRHQKQNFICVQHGSTSSVKSGSMEWLSFPAPHVTMMGNVKFPK